MKCPGTERCVKYLNQNQLELDCRKFNGSGQRCQGDPTNNEAKWRCKDGLCIDMAMVCNGKNNCNDGSDEEEGCELYGSDCKSWGGQEHVKCLVSESLSFSDTVICTLPQSLPLSENNEPGLKASYSCRNCSEPSEWRCDNGFCIKMLSPLQKSLLAFISLYSQISRATTKLGYDNPAQQPT